MRRVIEAGYGLTCAQDHGVTEAYYFEDPDANGVELYVDMPRDRWAVHNDGTLRLYSIELDLDDLLVELEPAGGLRAKELSELFRDASARFSAFVDGLSEEQWNSSYPKKPTTVGLEAHQIAVGYRMLLARLKALGRGEPIRQAAQARLDAAEAQQGEEQPHTTRVQVLRDLRQGAAPLCRNPLPN